MVKKVILTALFFILATGIFGALNTKAEACTTTQGWPGSCTEDSGCNQSAADTAWDKSIPECTALNIPSGNPAVRKIYGCCGTKPANVDFNPCKFVSDPKQQQLCTNCKGTWTAIGCITTDPTNPTNIVAIILKLGLGLAGGIAFLLILFGGLQIMTSAGNPEQLNAGRELITSAIIGLILVLFSIFLLQFIGVNIIGIPGFGTGTNLMMNGPH
jgi:hypothetical protein